MCVCCFFLFLIILSWLLFYFLKIIYLNQEWPTYGQPWIILRPSRFIVILLNNALGGGCSLEKVFERVTIFRRIVYTIANQMKKQLAERCCWRSICVEFLWWTQRIWCVVSKVWPERNTVLFRFFALCSRMRLALRSCIL